MSLIEVNNLYKIFGPHPAERALPMLKEGKGKKEILKKTGCTVGINNASFTVEEGEIFVVMGLSGSGKSTVIRCLNRLIEPTSGEVKIDGEDIVGMSKDRLRHVRRKKLGMVFQRFGLLPHRSVIDNVAFGLEIQKVPREERYQSALQAIETVGLKGYEYQMTDELSGGMQQRVGLARALANDPKILLMDEAFSALDPLIRVQLQDELLELQASMHKTIVFITHDLDEALKLGGRIAIMKDGAVVQIGTPEDILSNPADDYVAAFVENVDRSKVLTASSIMRPTDVIYDTAGPHQCARRMRQIGSSTMVVVNRDRHFLGYVKIDDVIHLCKKVPSAEDDRDKWNLRAIIQEDMRTADVDDLIADMLGDASAQSLPIAVIEKNKHFKGIVTRAAILGAIGGESET
ncbi:glycine betaine/L-proline ABC transporter ATP-binding protein [Ruficoccus amylovorans]|uniref:Glycine betaine/L-proline ABC transporter ATP-binding protein n=1 Tax=Ruficoccus amylovorans TaxID=1804625 RepID=A0A842HKP9_9BACT|nr:glycine betaine/L-proline ABC transporter ATP-binding protein [Ruficoccus amylovorans]MBC2595721.1 glycine betaine/L-proline ABC transporter ATP-binding protein [Ruficoccus amylovorans]